MKLIGMTGKAGAGKDTVADLVVAARQPAALKISMAAPLKRALAAMGLPEPDNRDLKEVLIPGFDFTWRAAAQRLGTDWGRALDRNIWIKLMQKQLNDVVESDARYGVNTTVVISDVRFENEAALVRQMGGQVWHITGRQADLGEAAAHASEAGVQLLPPDLVVHNNGSLQALQDVLTTWLEHQ